MTYPGAVIGIRARGVVRGEAPHASIEAMAADYLREIKTRQPNGPYYLCGYSSGGLVGVRDGATPVRIGRRGRTGRAVRHDDEPGAMAAAGLALHRRPARGATRRRFAGCADPRLAAPRCANRRPSRVARARRRAFITIRVVAAALLASAKYRPAFYRGQLTLFSSAEREPGLPSLESIWRQHARTVVVVDTEGTHATMLSTLHAETTAACVTRCLTAANRLTTEGLAGRMVEIRQRR